MVARRYVISAGMVIKNACGQPQRHSKRTAISAPLTTNKLGCSIESIHVAKQKRTEGLGVKAGKEPKWAQVDGSDGEVESGLDDTNFVGFEMGAQVTQDLLVALLGIH